VKRFIIVLPKADGGVEIYPMKEWLRQHPEQNLTKLDPTTSTSHQLRNALKRLGWTVDESETEVRLQPPLLDGRKELIDTLLGKTDPENGEEAEVRTDIAFSLEYQLRDFIAQNLNAIDVGGRRLRLYVDPAGNDGIEYSSPVGRIDILAIDDEGSFVVFELKRASSPDHAIGQLARYMGWVRQTIGKDREVRGVIVAKSISDKLRYAVSVIPNASLFEYEVKFELRSVHMVSA
jgi:endonuclease